MRRFIVSFVTSLLLTACANAPSVAVTGDRAVEAVAAFRTRLQAELKEGMARGPEHAVAVCRERAPKIAAESSTSSMLLGRTSDRVRNAANAPADWMKPVLQEFAANPDRRVARSIRLADGSLAYVEPIVIQPICLVCHGETIAPALHRKLAELYPDDRATGYRAGEFRGVFWAVVRH